MLFFRSFIFVLPTASSLRLKFIFFYRLDPPLDEEELLLSPIEEVEESKIVTEELSIEPSGLNMLWRIYEN